MTPDKPMDANAILDIVAREGMVDRASLTLEKPMADLAIESLEMINVLFAIEDEFGVVVDADDLESAKTVGDMVAMLLAAPRPS